MASLRNRMEPEGDVFSAPGGIIDPNDPAHAELIEQIRDRMERHWCREIIPALGGLTPSQAADDPTRREDLLRLLASFEANPSPAGSILMRPERLRKLLDLT